MLGRRLRLNLAPQVVKRLGSSAVLAGTRQGSQEAFGVGRRAQQVGRFEQTGQFVCGD